MNIKEALLLLLTHGIPILFFTYMATDVLLRNRKKTEHILISLISVCYLLLFAEEYVRNQVPIEYSPLLSSLWLSSVGIAIPGLGFHFLIKFTRQGKKLSRFIYPYAFYLPLIFVVFNLTTGAELISAQQFVQIGMWKLPVYNNGYYIAMTASIGINLLYLIPLWFAKRQSNTQEQRSIYNLLTIGAIISVIWNVLFGYIDYGASLPPYPYLYSGMIWCYFLRHTMKKHDFLNLYEKRYEQLFNLNPDAILLIDLQGTVKNANPGALQLFKSIQLELTRFFELLDPNLKKRIQAEQKIFQYETELLHSKGRLFILIDADYVWADNELHALLIVRDITVQKEHQQEIQFLAYHDPLTRLPNRRYFHEKLEEALLESEHSNESLALLLIDLDKIKLLNDTRGHLAGDEALQKAAQIIQMAVSDRGTAARMGGDEFILFIKHSPSEDEVAAIIQQMQLEFSQFISKFGNMPLGMSIGVSYFPYDGRDGQALINIADIAMFAMKRSRS